MKKSILILAFLGFLLKGHSQTTLKVVNGHAIEVTPQIPEKDDTLTTAQLTQKYNMLNQKLIQVGSQLKRMRDDSIQAAKSLNEYTALFKKLGIPTPTR